MITSSISGQNWTISQVDEDKAARLAARHNLSPHVARLLIARDIAEDQLASFLKPRLRDLLPDPSTMAQMDQAVETIARAINTGEAIAIFGDYDVDGISATALLKLYFDALGHPSQTYLPDRRLDGYGLNQEALDQIKATGCHFVITIDCCSKDVEMLSYAEAQKLNVVVLDHHPTAAPPPAAAFVNPNSSEDESALGDLTAVGVGFMFLVALNRLLRERRAVPDLMKFLDLVALGTICDVAPLTGLNRAFVIHGLELLARKNNIGLAELGEIAALRGRPNVESFSFALGPRLNAAGRIGKADLALALLTSHDADKAKALAQELNVLNRQRQAIERATLDQAVARITAQQDHDSSKDIKDIKDISAAIVIAAENWHVGVIGIVAARLRERYDCPAAVIALDGDQGVGSARGDGSVDLGLLMDEASHLLIKGGGHRQAAGFSIAASKIDAFRDFFTQACAAHRRNQPAASIVDMAIDLSAASRALYDELQQAAPFGKGHPHPRILFTDARLIDARASVSGHLRCRFQPAGGGSSISAIGFRKARTALGAALQSSVGELFHITGTLRPAWRDMGGSIEIMLDDAAPARARDAA